MLAYRPRRRPKFKSTLAQLIMFAGRAAKETAVAVSKCVVIRQLVTVSLCGVYW